MPINREVNNTYIDRCDDATRRDDSLGVFFFFLVKTVPTRLAAPERRRFSFRRAARRADASRLHSSRVRRGTRRASQKNDVDASY
jgi:hypothetical protein